MVANLPGKYHFLRISKDIELIKINEIKKRMDSIEKYVKRLYENGFCVMGDYQQVVKNKTKLRVKKIK